MWAYEKRLQYPVNIKRTDPKLAQAIISQFGGPDGELGASMRYLSQRYSTPYKEVAGVLTDIGTDDTKISQMKNIWLKNFILQKRIDDSIIVKCNKIDSFITAIVTVQPLRHLWDNVHKSCKTHCVAQYD